MEKNQKKHEMRLVITLIALAISSFTQVFAQQREVRIALCYDSTTFGNKDYRVGIAKSIGRALHSLEQDLKPEVRYRSCVDVPYFSFYGNPEAIFGREEALAALVEASYWVAALEALRYTQAKDKEAYLQDCAQLDWIDAYRLAKSRLYFRYEDTDLVLAKVQKYTGMSNEELTAYQDLVKKLHWKENELMDKNTNNDTFRLAEILYRGIVDNAMAFVIGHESYHFFGNKDLLQDRGTIETTGIFEALNTLQEEGRLLCPDSVETDHVERRADMSGLRILEQVDKKRQVEDNVINAIIRRGSIDIIAFSILSGFSLNDLKIDQANEYLRVKSYLFPEIRLLMFSAVLRANEQQYPWAVSIGGNTAEAFITTLQVNIQEYPDSDYEVTDEILDLLPKGVTTGFETGNWNEDSFKCKP